MQTHCLFSLFHVIRHCLRTAFTIFLFCLLMWCLQGWHCWFGGRLDILSPVKMLMSVKSSVLWHCWLGERKGIPSVNLASKPHYYQVGNLLTKIHLENGVCVCLQLQILGELPQFGDLLQTVGAVHIEWLLTGRMPFLSPNQRCQSILKGCSVLIKSAELVKWWVIWRDHIICFLNSVVFVLYAPVLSVLLQWFIGVTVIC